MNITQDHPLSWKALLRVVVVALSLYLIWNLYNVVIIILLSLVLASALNPIVKVLDKKLPISLSAVLVILILLLPIFIVIIGLVPGLTTQIPNLIKTLNIALKNSILPESIKNIDLMQYSENAGQYLLISTSTITSFITKFFTVIFLTIYILIDGERLYKMVSDVIPKKHRAKWHALITELAIINGNYLRGNLLITVICTIIIAIGLLLLNVPYAIPLAVFAGIVDLLPLIGAIIGLIPAVILGFTISPLTGFLVLALFLLYQQFENNILAPNIYNKVLSLSPTLSFVAVIIGSALLGIVGAFIALPVAASIPTIFKFMSYIQESENSPVSVTVKKDS
jgi:predicted PurR-regulated permease PerM